MKKRNISITLTLICSAFLSSLALANETMSAQAFTHLMQLEGQWQGQLDKSDGTSVTLQLNYSARFNVQQDTVVSTHYCGLMNKPVARLVSTEGGVIKFKTDATESGLEEGKDEYVDTWTLSLMPEDANQFKYEYTVIRPDRSIVTASAVVTRVE